MRSHAGIMRMVVILGVVALLFLAGCGGSTSQSFNAQPPSPSGSNPTPTITTISPTGAAAGGAPFTLTINGTNFIQASMVNFGGTAQTTTFSSATQLTAAIPAAAIASAGTAAVTVTNPVPGGGISNAVNFTITSGPNPVPAISLLDPSCAPAGGGAFNLFVVGSDFVASSVVQWNGSDRPTSVLNASNALAQIAASDIVATGTPAVTVFNPAPGGGSSNPSTFTVTPGGVNPQSIAVNPTGKFAYVANNGCPDAFAGSVSMYTIDATTGALASIGPPVDSLDEGARSVTVDPTGKFAYVANWGEGDTAGSVSMYTIDATTGALTFTGGISGACPGLCAPWSAVVDPSGKFAYVADEGGFSPTGVSMFTINATTGALTSIGTIVPAGRATAVAVDPTGKFAYVTNSDSNNVSMYTINGTTGALTSIGAIAAGTNPVFVAVDPTGKFAYVTNSGSNNVSMYTINTTTGALTSIGVIAAGTSPASVAVDPTGKFAYVANSGSDDVSMFSINGITGALTSIGTIAAGSAPSSIAIHPSGNFAYVTNYNSDSVSMYTINTTTGALTLIGTVGT
jgi:YVTN family beta-propeller protein